MIGIIEKKFYLKEFCRGSQLETYYKQFQAFEPCNLYDMPSIKRFSLGKKLV